MPCEEELIIAQFFNSIYYDWQGHDKTHFIEMFLSAIRRVLVEIITKFIDGLRSLHIYLESSK